VLACGQGGVDTSTPCWQLAKAPLIEESKRGVWETAKFGLYFVKNFDFKNFF